MAIVDASFADDEEHFVRVVRALRPVLRTRQDIWLQLREKHLKPPEPGHLIYRAAPAGWQAHEPVLLNGDRRLAQQLGLGLHHPEDTAQDADRNLPRRSASVHSAAAARRAVSAGVGVLLFGPVWDPGSKPGVGRGTEALGAICDAQDAWFLALGGIAPSRVRSDRSWRLRRGHAVSRHAKPRARCAGGAGCRPIRSLLTEPDPCWIHTPPRIGYLTFIEESNIANKIASVLVATHPSRRVFSDTRTAVTRKCPGARKRTMPADEAGAASMGPEGEEPKSGGEYSDPVPNQTKTAARRSPTRKDVSTRLEAMGGADFVQQVGTSCTAPSGRRPLSSCAAKSPDLKTTRCSLP